MKLYSSLATIPATNYFYGVLELNDLRYLIVNADFNKDLTDNELELCEVALKKINAEVPDINISLPKAYFDACQSYLIYSIDKQNSKKLQAFLIQFGKYRDALDSDFTEFYIDKITQKFKSSNELFSYLKNIEVDYNTILNCMDFNIMRMTAKKSTHEKSSFFDEAVILSEILKIPINVNEISARQYLAYRKRVIELNNKHKDK